MGYNYVFADQMRHFLKWFGRSNALGTAGYRINEVNGMKIFPIHDVTSEYLDQVRDGGTALPVRQLLSRRSRSGVQDQVVVLWRDLGDFATSAKANSYEANVRWLGSRPWIRVVTAQQIADNQIDYVGQDNNTYSTWGTESRGTEQNLVQTAKDWVDWATRENYDNWFNKLSAQSFGASSTFGRVGDTGHANAAWSAVNTVGAGNLQKVARAVIGGAMFQTAFHFPSATTDLRKFSTGAYINQANNTETMADFARHTQAQTRFAKVYERVQAWHANPTHDAVQADVDLDGQNEYLLHNTRIFAVFESKGGRMTAAWMRDPVTQKIWQVAGNFAAYANTDTEDEGANNATAYRTSGFKDWWSITGGTGSNTGVNANYTVTAAPGSAKGWTFSSGGVSKTITLPNANQGRITASYSLSGPSSLYVRFGLSPNLLDLMLRGHAGLTSEVIQGTMASVANTSGSEVVRAWVEGPRIVAEAVDTTAATPTTVQRRNQAQTHQVEVELTGAGPHTITLGFDDGGNTNPDSDGDGLLDSWELENFGNLNRDGSGDFDNDSLKDREEYVVGSNPKDASSGFPALAVESTGETFRVTFPTVAGRVYTVMARTNLNSGADWAPVSNVVNGQVNPVTGDGTTKTVTETGLGTTSGRFYRLKVEVGGN
jgi:hypothetical protein